MRHESESEIGEGVFNDAWPRSHAARVVKTRYRVADGILTWEIDVYRDYDLVLAEVELPSTDTASPIPAWLSGWVLGEVTDDPRFTNFAIASDGPPR